MAECSMTAEAQASDKELKITFLEVKKVYADPTFNCRGEIPYTDVIDLARDIQRHGLQSPIIVRPYTGPTDLGYTHTVVSGHRRHRAYEVNAATHIPCVIRDNLTEFGARTLNAIENLKRKDLNILQEAWTVKPYWEAKWSREDIADTLQMSPGWVLVRIVLLKLPEVIQQEAAAGILNQAQIRQLNTLKTVDEQYAAVKQIKTARQKSEGDAVVVPPVGKRKAMTKRRRQFNELMEAMDIIDTALGERTILSRILAWSAGNITEIEFWRSFQEYCRSQGKEFEIPEMEIL